MVKEVADFNSLRINSFLTVIKGTSNENEILYSQTRSKINIYIWHKLSAKVYKLLHSICQKSGSKIVSENNKCKSFKKSKPLIFIQLIFSQEWI